MSKQYLKHYEAVQLDPALEPLSNKMQDLILTDDLHLTKDAYDSILKEASKLLKD